MDQRTEDSSAGPIRKSDVPFIYRGFAQWWMLAGCSIALVAMFWTTVTRPGVIEFVVGIVAGISVGRLWARTWIGEITEMSLAGRERPWVKWIAMWFGRNWRVRQLTFLMTCFPGLALVGGIMYLLWRVAPGLPEPWARFTSAKGQELLPFQSIFLAVATFLVVGWLVAGVATLRWYRDLPRETDTGRNVNS